MLYAHYRGLGVIPLAVLAIASMWWVLDWYIAPDPDEPSQRKDVVQTLAQIIAGLVILGGLYFTRRTLHLNREGHVTDRFTKAIAQLGDDKLAIRLGGIYALERIARDSARDHEPIMQILTAFVRENAACDPHAPPIDHTWDQDIPPPPADIQAILTVLGRRTRTYGHGENERLNLTGTNLARAVLAGAQLQGAILRDVQLQRANLHCAQLQAAHLSGAQLQGAILFGAQLRNADLQEARLQSADLREAQSQGADLRYTQCRGANLTEAQIQGADLRHANLHLAILSGAQLQGAHLWSTHLWEANLLGAHLQRAQLRGAQLQGADLGDAQLHGADLSGAQLQGANLRRAHGLTQAQIDSADTDEHTNLPEGIITRHHSDSPSGGP